MAEKCHGKEGEMPPDGAAPEVVVEGKGGQVSAPKQLPAGSHPLPDHIVRKMVPVRFVGRERRPSFQWRG